jgi:hypothetical protein
MPYILRKTQHGYKVCKKSDPSKCFSKEGLPKVRAEAQMKAIVISEHKQGGKRETYAEARAREARQAEEFVKKNKAAKDVAHERTAKEARAAKLTRLVKELKQQRENLKQRIRPEYREEIMKQYNDDVEKVQNYDFYGVSNPRLRDQLDKQYLKMWNNMKNRPKVYGLLPNNRNTGYDMADPRYIKQVYEHYGQPEPDFLDGVAGVLEGTMSFMLGEIPVVGELFDTGMDIAHSYLDKEDQPRAGEEIGEINYDVLGEDVEKQLEEQEALQTRFTSELEDVEGKLGEYENELVSTQLTPQDISKQAQEMRGYGRPKNKKLYDTIKDKVYKDQPKHSLFRSARIQKEYKDAGGTYIGDKPGDKGGLKGWFDAKWISANDYVRGDIVPCGSARTEENYGEYPLCRPLKTAKKLGKEKLEKMIKVKDDLEEKPLLTEKVLGTKRYNVTKEQAGGGKSDQHTQSIKFQNQLKKIGMAPDDYMSMAKHLAKQRGYDPTKVHFSVDGDHKLVYDSPEGIRRFGKVGYGDFIIWTWLEKKGEVPKGTAKKKQDTFHKSHRAMSKKYALTKYDENELALNINW